MNLHEMNIRIEMDKRDTWAAACEDSLWNKGAQPQVCWCRLATLAFSTQRQDWRSQRKSWSTKWRAVLKDNKWEHRHWNRQWPCHSGTAPQFCAHCRTEQSALRQWIYNHRRKRLEWQSVCWLSVNSGLFLSWDCLATLHGPSWSRTQFFLS